MAHVWHTLPMTTPTESPRSRLPSRDEALSVLEGHLDEAEELLARLHPPTLAAVRRLAEGLAAGVSSLNERAGLEEPQAGAVLRWALADPALAVLVGEGRSTAAAAGLAERWRAAAVHLAGLGGDEVAEPAPAPWPAAPPPAAARLTPEDLAELVAVWPLAVAELALAEGAQARGRRALRRLMVHLGLSQNDLGRMLGTSGETVRRWEGRAVRVPEERLAELGRADDALDRLLALVRPEHLRQAVRREAGLFDGDRALDWILRGRLAEVAGRYEVALAYQA